MLVEGQDPNHLAGTALRRGVRRRQQAIMIRSACRVRVVAPEIALTGVGQVGTLDAVHALFPITPPPRA
jgi:hypothetical protein